MAEPVGIPRGGCQRRVVRKPESLPTLFCSRHPSGMRLTAKSEKHAVPQERSVLSGWHAPKSEKVGHWHISVMCCGTYSYRETAWIFHSLIIQGLPEGEAGTKGRESTLSRGLVVRAGNVLARRWRRVCGPARGARGRLADPILLKTRKQQELGQPHMQTLPSQHPFAFPIASGVFLSLPGPPSLERTHGLEPEAKPRACSHTQCLPWQSCSVPLTALLAFGGWEEGQRTNIHWAPTMCQVLYDHFI